MVSSFYLRPAEDHFPCKVKKIIYLNDGEVAVVRKNNVEVTDLSGNLLNKKVEEIGFNPEVISKHGYKHFMLKEINEQPDILRKVLAQHIKASDLPVNLGQVKLKLDWQRIENISIIACGTSLHAAMVTKYVWENWLGLPVQIEAASEYIYRKNTTGKNSLVIGISQSGETADTITAVKQAKEKSAQVLIVTNREDSSIVRYADSVLPLEAGIEISVAATKSYSAQLLAMYWLGLYVAEQKKTLQPAELGKIKQEMLELPAKMEEVLSNAENIKSVADKLQAYKSVIYIARGSNQASALEGALKLKEISYINANGYAAGELKHGPIALLDENMPVIAVLAQGETYAKMLSNCEEVKARNAKLIAVTSVKDKHADNLFDDILRVPEIREDLSSGSL